MEVLFVICLFAFLQNCLTEDAPTVKVKQGLLKGSVRTTRNGKPFFAFQSIPYAEPPVADLRFNDPVPGKSWDGILDATKEHPRCVQVNIFSMNNTYLGKEDCLYLNVYTPKISEDDLLPVIFFIHGGGFVMSDANPTTWGPYSLLDKDVIFVAPNYRLGALGFLSTGDKVSPGNNGLKDQSLALNWVKHNIKQFGGNPKKITITGQSAGAASTYFHLLSPLSKHIPYAAIALSGIAPALWTLSQKGEAERNAKRLAIALNCTTNSSKEMISCLRNVSAYDILQETINFRVFNYDPTIPFKPVIDSYIENSFLPKHPIKIIRSGQMAQIPFMTGITTDDGAMKSTSVYHYYGTAKKLNSHFNQYFPVYMNYDEVGFDTNSTSVAIRKYYFQDKEINNDTKTELTDLGTDSLFMVPARLTATLHAKHSNKPVYFYLFGYKGSTSYSKIFGDPQHDYGVCHCDDLLYLIPNSYVKHNASTEDLKMTDVMTTIWYNFVTTGDPTPDLNSFLTTKWDPVVSDELEYYFIKDSSNLKMNKNLYEERFRFWKELPILNEINRLMDEL